MTNYSSLNDQLSKRTSIFGLRLWVVLGICVGAAIVLVLFVLSLWFTSRRSRINKKKNKTPPSTKFKSYLNNVHSINNPTIPNVSKEIQEIVIDRTPDPKTLTPDPVPESEHLLLENGSSPVAGRNRIHIEIGKDHIISYPKRADGSGHGSGENRSGTRSGDQGGGAITVPEVSHLGWGHWYTLRELEESTNGFADENVIGEGGYGIVYHGVLKDNSNVVVKNLLNKSL